MPLRLRLQPSRGRLGFHVRFLKDITMRFDLATSRRDVPPVVALLSVLALMTLWLASQPAWGTTEIQGTVVDSQGQTLAGLEVRVFGPRGDNAGGRAELARTTSDEQGQFRLETPPGIGELLELQGPAGTGRLRITERPLPLEITYPVPTTVVLLHDNDLHFDFNHQEAFGAVVQDIRDRYEHVFLVNAGDIFIRHSRQWPEPTQEFYAQASRQIIEAMNRFGYDVLTLGNHEMDYQEDATLQALSAAEFPLLVANVDITTELLPPVAPYTVLRTDNDLTIAVLGLGRAVEKEGVRAHDPIRTAEQYVHLADEHDIFVALTHIGFRTDQQLAEAVGVLDVIIGGHSHTMLEEAVLVNGVLIAQTRGTSGPATPDRPKYLGKVILTLENDRILDKQGQVFTLTAESPIPTR